jgi:hypothetical protein
MQLQRCSLVALAFLCSRLACAQVNTSAITGVVTDKTGNVIPNAAASIVQVGTGPERQTATEENGEYVVRLAFAV